MSSRVVMDLAVGERIVINDRQVTIRFVEKTGRSRARLVFELDSETKLKKEHAPIKAGELNAA